MSSTPSFRWYALVCAGMWWHASFSVTGLNMIYIAICCSEYFQSVILYTYIYTPRRYVEVLNTGYLLHLSIEQGSHTSWKIMALMEHCNSV